MTLTVSNTILDEEFRATQTGTGDDNDVPVGTFDASTIKTQITALSLNLFSSPSGFPQHAEKQSFVSSTNPVTDYELVVASGGVATNLYVGSNQVFLYATSNSNIVVGRLGSGTTADPAGSVVLIIGVEETKNGGGLVTNADMWLCQYAPFVDGGLNLVDSLDQLDLSGLVTLKSTYNTVTEVPFENFDGVPSGNNLFNVIFPSDGSNAVQLLLTGSVGETLSTVNVSSTGIGAGSQHIDVGYTLRIDTVQGMVKANVDSAPEVNQSSNIDYADLASDPGTDARVEIIKADFEITQVNPGSTPERVDIIVSAFNAAGAPQEGAYLTDAIATDGTPVAIAAADVKILDNAGNDITAAWLALPGTDIIQMGNSVKVVGLNDGTSADKTDGDRVSFSTDSPFDRFLITNADASTTFDVGNIHVTSIVGGTATESTDVGDNLIFQDDGPKIALSGNSVTALTADDSTFGSNPSGSFAGLFNPADYGADGAGTTQYILGVKSANVDSLLDDTLTGQSVLLSYDSATNTVFGKTAGSGVEVFRITVNSSGQVTLDQSRAVVHGDTGSFDESTAAMAADLITLSAKATDSEGAATGDSAQVTAQIGNKFLFKDDGPALTPQGAGSATPNNLQVDNNLADAADSTDSSSYGLVPGGDGQKSYTIAGPADNSGDFQWTYNDATNTSITGTYKGANLYTLALNPATGGYAFTMIGSIPGTELPLSSAEIKAGGPQTNSIDVGILGSDPRFVNIAATGGPINESNDNVGVTNGNFDTGEALTFKLFDGATQLSFLGMNIGTKSASGGTYNWSATPTGGGTALTGTAIVEKNGTIVVDTGGVLINSITITKASGSTTKIGLDDIDILVPPNDVQLGFTVELKDGDNDPTTASFTVDIDADNDGDFESNVNALSLPADPTALSFESVHDAQLSADHLFNF